jgi:hypothetical protein
VGYSVRQPSAVIVSKMEPNSAAEDLPALYRAVLDRVAEIAASGRRPLANEVRSAAIRIYSRAWDERARRELEALLQKHTLEAVNARSRDRDVRRHSVRAT